MNSLSRGWLFLIFFAVIAVIIFTAGGFAANRDIRGSVLLGDQATDVPALADPGPASGAKTSGPTGASSDDTGTTGDGAQPVGSVVAGEDQILPSGSGTGSATGIAAHAGDRATARSVRVEAVDADEGFWIGTAGRRVWVQLTGQPPESPYHVRPGDRVSFSGTVVRHNSGFADRVGVSRAEGARSLSSQGAHIDVVKRALTLNP